MSTAPSRGKRWSKALLLLMLPLLLGAAYKWRDAEGQLHLTDEPPPPGVAYEVVGTPHGPARAPTPPVAAPSPPLAVPQSPVPAAPAVDEEGLAARRAELDRRCVEALYQLELLGMQQRVFKPGPGDTRTYLDDRNRPSEIERLNHLKDETCIGDEAYLSTQRRKANALLETLSPGCRESREQLEYMRRDPRTPRRDLEAKEERVGQLCPDVPDLADRDLWLGDWVLVR